MSPTDIRVDEIVDMARTDGSKLRAVAKWALAMERHDTLTEAAEMLERARQPAAALGLVIMRDKKRPVAA